jgi:NAD(P)-dependent dehydrogenase (short-subunit alcohol dehydrogenase family)
MAEALRDGTLEGKNAVVTGGSCGIGRTIVQRLADDGTSVAFSFVANQAAADEIVASVVGAGDSGGTGRRFVAALQADQGRSPCAAPKLVRRL